MIELALKTQDDIVTPKYREIINAYGRPKGTRLPSLGAFSTRNRAVY